MAKKDRHITLFVVSRYEFKDKETKQPSGKGFELRVVHVVGETNESRGTGVEKVYFYEGGMKSIPKVLEAKDLSKLAEKWGGLPDNVWAMTTVTTQRTLDVRGPIPPLPIPEPLTGGAGLGGGEGLGGGSLGGTSLGGDAIKKTDDF